MNVAFGPEQFWGQASGAVQPGPEPALFETLEMFVEMMVVLAFARLAFAFVLAGFE